jgi:putative tryptophan/tyrosine transport system substrate-binding protein
MRRREFIAGAASASAMPLAAGAQQFGTVRRLGVLTPIAETDAEGQARLAALRNGLRKLGWVEGSNLQIDLRAGAGENRIRLREQAGELVALKPDVLFAAPTPALAAMREATRILPIVFAQVADPVGAGYVATLAHPGGNVTGFAQYEPGLAGKWLELLKQIAPKIVRAAVVHDPTQPTAPAYLRSLEASASSEGTELERLPARNAEELESVIAAFASKANGGLIVLPSPLVSLHRGVIVKSAAERRLPAVYPWRYFVADGGLACYGTNTIDLYQRAAGYIDRILRGEKPADLPVQLATKFELVINLATARKLGLDIPPMLLVRADEVIE